MEQRRFRAVHDLSEGGLAVAAAEMAFGGGGLGLDLEIPDAAEPMSFLFGEGPHRFLMEMDAGQWETFQAECAAENIPAAAIGKTMGHSQLTMHHLGKSLVDAPVADLKKLWQQTLEAAWPVE